MQEALQYTKLAVSDIPELEGALRNQHVYKFIGTLPSKEDFTAQVVNAINGPGNRTREEVWINFVVRRQLDGDLLGRLEVTVHDGLAEVAFLYKPACWGHGYASKGLAWLHNHLRGYSEVSSLWGTTHPENYKSASLLERHGYQRVEINEAPSLYSHDAGDLIFRFELR